MRCFEKAWRLWLRMSGRRCYREGGRSRAGGMGGTVKGSESAVLEQETREIFGLRH